MGKKKFEYDLDKMIAQYGYQFVKEAVEQAIDRKNLIEQEHEIKSERRIVNMAREMGVRLG